MKLHVPTFTKQPLGIKQKIRKAGLASAKSATFGMVRNGGKRAHQGVDLAVDKGYRVYAVESGSVVGVNQHDDGSYGLTVTLKLDCSSKPELHGKFAFYAHLSSVRVKAGQQVAHGAILGLTGDTGNARGMDSIPRGGHLHFELRTAQRVGLGLTGRVDPLPFLELSE